LASEPKRIKAAAGSAKGTGQGGRNVEKSCAKCFHYGKKVVAAAGHKCPYDDQNRYPWNKEIARQVYKRKEKMQRPE
jgi:hypothetical protein